MQLQLGLQWRSALPAWPGIYRREVAGDALVCACVWQTGAWLIRQALLFLGCGRLRVAAGAPIPPPPHAHGPWPGCRRRRCH